MSNAFVQHLLRACAKPINELIFCAGYEQSIEGVKQAQDFNLHGLQVHSPCGVYSPHETSSTRFVMDQLGGLGMLSPDLSEKGSRKMLEIGCGAGAVSLLAAMYGWDVLATDIDAVAVQATLENALNNGLQVRTRVSDLFAQLHNEQFDVIAFNQPFYHLPREIRLDERTLSSHSGELHARFLKDAKSHLNAGGFVLFTYSNCSDASVLQQPGWELELQAFDFSGGADYIRALFKATPTNVSA